MGDIRKSIIEAVSKNMKNSQNKWDPESQPNIYELANFLRKSGYRLIDVLIHKNNDTPELLIEPIKSDYLHPEISHDISEGYFYAKIVEHGMLVASDLEEIIKGYNNALGVLDYLQSLDLSILEVNVDEE